MGIKTFNLVPCGFSTNLNFKEHQILINDLFIAQYMGELALKYMPYKFTYVTPCNLVGTYRRFGETAGFF